MRFKRYIPVVTILLSGVYIIFLALNNDLDLYIHSRYVLFTIVMSVLGVATVAIGHALNKSHVHGSGSTASMLPLFIILACAVFLPARSLTSATVSQRTISSNPQTNSQESTTSLLAQSSKILTLRDWSRLLSTNGDEDFYTNKTATVSGFVYDAGLGEDTLWLARFVVTFCAVDAQPIGVPVHLANWSDKYQQDEWLSVEGKFEKRQTDQGEQIVLIPESVDLINEPENPYAN